MRTIALAVASLAVSLAARAADAPPRGAARGSDEKYIQYMKDSEDLGPDPELELQHYHRQLNLSEAQKKQVKQIFLDQRVTYKKSHAMRTKFQGETRALQLKLLELNKKFNEESKALEDAHQKAMGRMRDVLTAEQKAGFDSMQEQRGKQERDWRTRREEESRRRELGPGGAGPGGYMGWGDPPPAEEKK